MNAKANLITKISTKASLGLDFTVGKPSDGDSSDEIKYIWSRDPNHLRDYTKLIDLYYENEMNLSDTYKKIDGNDFNSYFLIVQKSNEVISGARVTINIPESQTSLPNEKLGFNYSQIFPELDLTRSRFCEVSRYAMHENYRRMGIHYENAFKMFYDLTSELKIKYLFILASSSRIRLYARYARKYFTLRDEKKYGVGQFNPSFELECSFVCFENLSVK